MLQPLVDKLNGMRVVLASSSKQRCALLESVKLKFEVCKPKFEENLNPADYSFRDFVEETALGKVEDVCEQLNNQPDLVMGFDTMVTHDGLMYGKPASKEEASEVIRKLTSGGPNVVYTGVVIKYREKIVRFTETTTVYMGRLSEEEIAAYVESGEPMGKAGGYGIQGVASSFVERIDGDSNNVVGLPLFRLTQKLKELIV